MATKAQRSAIHHERVMTAKQKARRAAGQRETRPEDLPVIPQVAQERRNTSKAIEDLADRRELERATGNAW